MYMYFSMYMYSMYYMYMYMYNRYKLHKVLLLVVASLIHVYIIMYNNEHHLPNWIYVHVDVYMCTCVLLN